MKRAKVGLTLLLCIVMVMGMMAVHAVDEVKISSFSASINSEKVVKIEGYMSTGVGNQVGIRILSTDEVNPLTYVNEITTGDGGYFNIIYTMKDATEGVTYAVMVRATDGDTDAFTTANATFVYRSKVDVMGISLNKNKANITVGSNDNLSATIVPTNATNKNITWTSSDSTVATVDATGKVTGIKAGTATIIVKTEDGSKTSECQVIVTTVTGSTSGTTTTVITADKTTLTLEGDIVKIIPTQEYYKDLGKSLAQLDSKTLIDAFSKAKETARGTKSIKIEFPKIAGANSYEISMPAEFMESLSYNQKIEIISEFVSINISGNLLDTVQGLNSASKISLSLKNVDKSLLSEELQKSLGSGIAIDISLYIDGVSVPWNNKKSPVSVSIPYTPSADELKNPEHITVWYLDNGKGIAIPNARYDLQKGVVTFETTHFSNFAVVSVFKTFDDLENFKWAKNAVEVICSKGIASGTSSKTFSPQKNITRAEYITLLVKTLGLSAEENNCFEDVKTTDYYYEAICTAKKLGITKGVSEKLFCPKAEISRQDMMVMTKLAMVAVGKIKASDISALELDRFKDKAEISKYALESIAALVNEGLISGSGNKIYAKNNSTRAESAVLLYKVYNK